MTRLVTRFLGQVGRRGLCSASEKAGRTTHFGYTTVPEEEKQRLVKHVFENVASRYDVMNDLMSGGVHRVWKDTLVKMLGVRSLCRADLQVLDVAGGTGDVAFRISRALSALTAESLAANSTASAEPARIVVSDINEAMLEEGRRRAATMPDLSAPGAPRLEFVVANAQELPFEDNSFDMYSIAFGIRNVTHIDKALAEVWHAQSVILSEHATSSKSDRTTKRPDRPTHQLTNQPTNRHKTAILNFQARRVLRPGGRFVCLEFSQVTNPVLRSVYDRCPPSHALRCTLRMNSHDHASMNARDHASMNARDHASMNARDHASMNVRDHASMHSRMVSSRRMLRDPYAVA